MNDKMKYFFKMDPVLGVSRFRFQLLRLFYAIIVIFLGIEVWTEIVTHEQLWQPLPGVAFGFWGSFSLLALLGIIHPLKMLPLLLVQFSYKLIWLVIVAYPSWRATQLTGFAQQLAETNLAGVMVDLIVIPWPYVWKNFIKRTVS